MPELGVLLVLTISPASHAQELRALRGQMGSATTLVTATLSFRLCQSFVIWSRPCEFYFLPDLSLLHIIHDGVQGSRGFIAATQQVSCTIGVPEFLYDVFAIVHKNGTAIVGFDGVGFGQSVPAMFLRLVLLAYLLPAEVWFLKNSAIGTLLSEPGVDAPHRLLNCVLLGLFSGSGIVVKVQISVPDERADIMFKWSGCLCAEG